MISRPRASLPGALALVAGVAALTGCEPGWGVFGDVLYDPEELGGKPLIVVVMTGSAVDDHGVPIADAETTWFARATLLGADRSYEEFSFATRGCEEQVRILAWVDADGSEDLAMLDEGAMESIKGTDEPTDDELRIAAMRPSAGDWVAFSEVYAFPRDGLVCSPDYAQPMLVLAPLGGS